MSAKDFLLLEYGDKIAELKAKVKVLRVRLRKEKRWSFALLTVHMGDPLSPSQEKEFGEILDKL